MDKSSSLGVTNTAAFAPLADGSRSPACEAGIPRVLVPEHLLAPPC